MIPLVELSDPRVGNIYGVAPDRETLEVLARAAARREGECTEGDGEGRTGGVAVANWKITMGGKSGAGGETARLGRPS